MLVVNWLLARKVESVDYTDSDSVIVLSVWSTDSTFLASSQLTTSIHWLCYCTVSVINRFYLPSKVESVDYTDSTITESMNAGS
jgi:hypothetical protein